MASSKKRKRRTKRTVPTPRCIDIGSTSVGLGLFARYDLDDEERLGEVGGEVIYDPNYESDYCIELDDMTSLEPTPPFRYLNHSCDPNCEFGWEEIDGETRIFVETLRPIGFGEELTIDYAWPKENAIPCQCQSAWCRGWVVDADELPDLLDSLEEQSADEVDPAEVESAVDEQVETVAL